MTSKEKTVIHLLLRSTRKTILIISTVLLTACSSTPASIQLSPKLSVAQTAQPLQSKSGWSIGSQDQRIAHYLIEISSGDDAATLINESQSSRLIIENNLRKQWLKEGLTYQADSPSKIEIQLIKLLTKVEQKNLTYENQSKIVINIKLRTENKIFSKTFTSRFTEEGIFTPEIKKLNTQLNTQLSQLLNEIIKDPELNAKLQQL